MKELVLDRKTVIMGILNATPDSFSDGGRFFGFEKAVQRGKELVAEGADIVDIGGESSRPFSEPVSQAEEMDRVIPVIESLAKQVDVPISIDTVKASVAREAVKAGAGMINDISALERDPAMASVVKEAGVPVILMHMKGTPETMQINPEYGDLLGEITRYLQQRADFAVEAGIKKERIILDPGIGFGKTVRHNLAVINHMDAIASIGFPVLVGPSRKSFVQKILAQEAGEDVNADCDECENGTLAALAAARIKGCHIVRVHDVKRAKPFLTILDAIKSE
ncbi:MAG: dihydropteroate synthase [Desulfarculaceae bacterium]|nr:dihydropteroate synthase [Desulfarculaceae bacterium]